MTKFFFCRICYNNLYARMNSFPTLTPYTFGSMSLGSEPLEVKRDVAVARKAMEAGVWFHSSPTYHKGFTYMILRMAFDECRSQQPKLILKIRDAEPALVKFEVEDALRRLGLEQIDIIQLVHDKSGSEGRTIVGDFLNQGERWELVQRFKQEGKVGSAVLFLTRDRGLEAREALDTGLFDGVTFYNNLMEFDVPAGLKGYIQGKKDLPILALRSVYGGLVAGKGELDGDRYTRAQKLQQIASDSGCRDLVELSMCYAASNPQIRTTIGGTRNPGHLATYLELAESARPLGEDALQAIGQIQL